MLYVFDNPGTFYKKKSYGDRKCLGLGKEAESRGLCGHGPAFVPVNLCIKVRRSQRGKMPSTSY